MARFALVALCVTTAVGIANAGMSPLDYGVAMVDRAYTNVCWYENLKKFPETNAKGFGQCGTTVSQFKKQIMDPDAPNAAHYKKYPDQKPGAFGKALKTHAMKKLPSEYGECTKYLDKPDDEPPADEADVLNDANSHGYPFKAFAMCLMQTLRNKEGDEAINAIKNERTHKKKDWRQTLLDRENAFRARHGAKPLKMVPDLNDAAQEWADDNAGKCKMYHSKNKDAGRQWRGKSTGESISQSPGTDKDGARAAYYAADGWYEEIKDYPWPEYEGDGTDDQFMAIGHFTQSVWDESEYVGYGYGHNPDCKSKENYVVARYSPPGNLPGAFGKHVKPIKE